MANGLLYLLPIPMILALQGHTAGKSGRDYLVTRTDIPIWVDGVADDPGWWDADQLDFFVPVTSAVPRTRTKAGILWDDTHLYIFFQATDRQLLAEEAVRDNPVYKDDVLEFFFQPPNTKGRYYNIEINALGTVFDAHSGKAREFDWKKMRHAWILDGTLNDDSDIDNGWTLELAIPFDEIVELNGQAPKPGDEWKFHLARYDYDPEFPNCKELSSTTHLSKVSFHHLADWQTLRFGQ